MRKIRISRVLGNERTKINVEIKKNYWATPLICSLMSSNEGNTLLDINAVCQERSKSLSLFWVY